MSQTLSEWASEYQNTAEINDYIFRRFTQETDEVSFLKEHRDFVEQNNWGMGFRAFHYLWYLLLQDCAGRFEQVSALEIGVFKGQTISLWDLICRNLDIELQIAAISPFSGNRPASRMVRSLKKRFSRKYQDQRASGSLYYERDYLRDTAEIFQQFGGDIERVRVMTGLSTDRRIFEQVRGESFSLIYIDGDHTESAVRSDIERYGKLVQVGGFLVMDDAGSFLPTTENLETKDYRGYESVARACEAIEPLGFVGILNVGHNRIYKRVSA